MSVSKIALVPAFDPDAALIGVARGLKESGFDVLVVNDGSGLECADIFEKAGEYGEVISHSENRGKGAAIKTGLRHISEHFSAPYTVVTVDADGQHRVEDAAAVCNEAEKHPDALVLGGRRFSGKVPLRSRFGNTVTRFVFRLSSGVRVYDTQTGLRAFSDSNVPFLLSVSGDRYEYEMNALMSAARSRILIRELKIATIYTNDNQTSHFKPIRDSYRIYKEILRFSLSSFIGFLVDYAMYCLLFGTTKQLILSNVIARVVSASVNYTLNRKVVFKSKNSLAKSAIQYFLLAAGILACNTGLLKLLTFWNVNVYAAKIITEIVMFSISWLVQHKIIFKKNDKRD